MCHGRESLEVLIRRLWIWSCWSLLSLLSSRTSDPLSNSDVLFDCQLFSFDGNSDDVYGTTSVFPDGSMVPGGMMSCLSLTNSIVCVETAWRNCACCLNEDEICSKECKPDKRSVEMTWKAHVSVEIEWTCLDSVSFLSTEYIRADVNTAGVVYLFLKNSYSLCVLRVWTIMFAGLGTLLWKFLFFWVYINMQCCAHVYLMHLTGW